MVDKNKNPKIPPQQLKNELLFSDSTIERSRDGLHMKKKKSFQEE